MCTANSAKAIGAADRLGSLEAGRQADISVLGVEDYCGLAISFFELHCIARSLELKLERVPRTVCRPQHQLLVIKFQFLDEPIVCLDR